MDEEEQVVGVVKFCDVCGEKTVHVDGVCRDHKVVRRRKAKAVEEVDEAPAEQPAPRPAPTAPRKKKKKKKTFGRIKTFFALVFVGALIAGMGFIHIAYGGSSAIKVCRKDGWSLKHSLVSVHDEMTAQKPDLELLKTLSACGALPGPSQ
ncbi:MAG TPA: hypothetical protein VGM90_23850 [Kofleriaceae bacterium]|jgi:hypothetical protein